MPDEGVIEGEELEKATPGVEPEAPPQEAPEGEKPAGAEPEEAPEGGIDVRLKRVVGERNEERERRIHLEGRLEAMERQLESSRTQKPQADGFDPAKDRELFAADPYAWAIAREERRAREIETRESAREKAQDERNAERLLVEAPERTHPDFHRRVRELMDEWFPNDPNDTKWSVEHKIRKSLQLYRKEYGEKPRATIKEAPATGGKKSSPAPTTAEVTDAMLEDAMQRYNEGPDAKGLGWGARKHKEWREKGLIA